MLQFVKRKQQAKELPEVKWFRDVPSFLGPCIFLLLLLNPFLFILFYVVYKSKPVDGPNEYLWLRRHFAPFSYVSHLNPLLHSSSVNSQAPNITPSGQIFLQDVYYKMYQNILSSFFFTIYTKSRNKTPQNCQYSLRSQRVKLSKAIPVTGLGY
jgi:hypothetical protein